MPAAHFIVTTTFADRDLAALTGRYAVGRRLAACAQVHGPVSSVYWWRGELEEADEYVLNLKTAAHRLAELVAALRADHPYDNPEIVATPIEDGSRDYLAWIDAETAPR